MLKLPNGNSVALTDATVHKAKLLIAQSLEEFYPSIVLYNVNENDEINIFQDPQQPLPSRFAVLVDDPLVLETNPFSEEEWLAVIVEHAFIEDKEGLKRAASMMNWQGLDGKGKLQDIFFHLVCNDPYSENHLEELEIACIALIEAGVNPNTVNKNNNEGETPLTKCAKLNRKECVKMLLRIRCDVNTKNVRGDTALMIATRATEKKMVQILVDNKASIDIVNNAAEFAIIHCVVRQKYDFLAFLVDNKADLNKVNKIGETALLKAIEKDDTKAAQILILKGATTEKIPGTYKTPRKFAKQLNSEKMVNAIDYACEQANPKKTNNFLSTGFVRTPNQRQKNIGYNKVQLRYGYGSVPKRNGTSALNPIVPRKVVEIRSSDLSYDDEKSSEEEERVILAQRATEQSDPSYVQVDSLEELAGLGNILKKEQDRIRKASESVIEKQRESVLRRGQSARMGSLQHIDRTSNTVTLHGGPGVARNQDAPPERTSFFQSLPGQKARETSQVKPAPIIEEPKKKKESKRARGSKENVNAQDDGRISKERPRVEIAEKRTGPGRKLDTPMTPRRKAPAPAMAADVTSAESDDSSDSGKDMTPRAVKHHKKNASFSSGLTEDQKRYPSMPKKKSSNRMSGNVRG